MTSANQPRPPALRETHLRDYWKIVWQGRWTLLAVFFVVLGATALWTFLQTPIYRATAIVEIQARARSLMSSHDMSGIGAAGFGWVAEEKYHNTQIQIIKSRDIAERVVNLLGLDSHPSFAQARDPVAAFQGLIAVEPRRDTELLEISITWAQPDEAAQWANAVAQAYTDRNYEKARENIDEAVSAVRDQLTDLISELDAVEKQRIKILMDTQIFDPENNRAMLTEEILDYTEKLTEVRVEAAQLESTLEQVEQMRIDGVDLLSLPIFANDEMLQDLGRDRVEAEKALTAAKRDFREGHPNYDKALEALSTANRNLEQRTKLIVAGLQRRLADARSRAEMLSARKLDAEREQIKIATAEGEHEAFKVKADTLKQLRDVLLSRAEEVQLSAELLNNNVDVLDEALVPGGPIKPRKRVNLVLGAVFGVFVGLASVFFLDYLDNTIRTPEEVERYLGVAVLGVVPKMDDRGLSQRAVREAYQSLRTSVIFSSKNRQHRIVLTTSTGPREGKSSTVANLGRTLAAAGDRVIIIDCDLRRPKQHQYHELPREPGLTNYLAAEREDRDWARFVRGTQPNLDVLTSGPIPPSPPELLGNERFSELLMSLRDRYDWVLIDSPPAANLADASVLSSLAEMVILVVRHNATDRDHVIKTYQQLRSYHGNVAGVVLNSVDLGRAYHKDYYYAGYYYEDETETAPRKARVEREAKVG